LLNILCSLSSCLNFLYNYFDDLALFSDLYLAKFLNTLTKDHSTDFHKILQVYYIYIELSLLNLIDMFISISKLLTFKWDITKNLVCSIISGWSETEILKNVYLWIVEKRHELRNRRQNEK